MPDNTNPMAEGNSLPLHERVECIHDGVDVILEFFKSIEGTQQDKERCLFASLAILGYKCEAY